MTPDLTTQQLQTLKTAIQANAGLAGALAAGAINQIAAYYNGPGVGTAWQEVDARALRRATKMTKFDNLTTQGKRDSWRMFVDYAPVDFRIGDDRGTVTDVWGAADGATLLLKCAVRPTTKAEDLFGGTDKTEATVTATVLTVEGELTAAEVERALRG